MYKRIPLLLPGEYLMIYKVVYNQLLYLIYMFTNYYEETVPKDPLITFYVNGTTKEFTK